VQASPDPRLERLEAVIRDAGPALTAFSGGVDSTLVAAVSHRVHGPLALAVTGVSPSLARAEADLAAQVAAGLGLRHRLVETHEIASEGYRANAGNRCYFCKSELFGRLSVLARDEGLAAVFSGDNLDDVRPGSHRPGMRAAQESGVRKPLIEADLTKADVRQIAHALGLPNHAKPASPCLASRVPHGTRVTPEVLARIESAEAGIRALGFTVFRVRHHGQVARIEVCEAELDRAFAQRAGLLRACRDAGYLWGTLDLAGFASGSLNAALK
jgi:uncharacterized protein